MQKNLIKTLATAFSFFILSHTLYAAEVHSDVSFISVADIHFAPYSDCEKNPCPILNKLRQTPPENWQRIFEEDSTKKISAAYQDTNYALLASFFNDIDQINKKEHPAFVLILGDFLAHDFRSKYRKFSGDKSTEGYENFVKKTFQFLTLQFMKAFPNTDVYPVIGNNDSYSGDYKMLPHGNFLSDLTLIWAPLIKNSDNQNHFKNEFPIAGYYEVIPPGLQKEKIILLNSVLFSNRLHSKTITNAAHNELQWFNQSLKNAAKANQKVLIADHIPVGIDIFATIMDQFKWVKEFWHTRYTTEFEKILKPYTSSVIAIISGHIHIDTFQIITSKKVADIPVYITPSISPIFGNNPAFKVFYLNDISDFNTYSLSLDEEHPQWQTE